MKKWSISDKNLGYLVFSIVVMLILAATSAMALQNKHTVHRITVTFEQIGTLQPQDRIVEKGVPIGQIFSVEYKNKKAYVIVDFDNPIKIRKGSIIRNSNYSLMGDRMLLLLRSPEGDFADENYIWEGEFESGIAEALHLMDGVLSNILLLQQQLVSFIEGDTSQPSLTQRFHAILKSTEQNISSLDFQLRKYKRPLEKAIKNAATLGQQTTIMAETTQKWITNQTQKSDTLLLQLEEIQNYSEVTISAVHSQLNHLDSSAFVLNHLDKKDLLVRLETVSNGVYKLTQYFLHKIGGLRDEDGNPVGIFRFRNVNFFGETAREKRKKANLQ